jgi:hypothetical protein
VVSKISSDNSQEFQTTSFVVHKPSNFSELSQHVRLERYVLPFDYLDNSTYPKVHTQIQDQLSSQPYSLFRHDIINKPVVYVLYRVGESVLNLTYRSGTESVSLAHQPIDLDHIAFHNVVKLLQVDYFRGRRQLAFTSQGDCVSIVRVAGKSIIALKIKLKQWRGSPVDDPEPVFVVESQAQRYIPFDAEELSFLDENRFDYFIRRTIDAGEILTRVKSNKVLEKIRAGDSVYYHFTKGKHRVNVPYHLLGSRMKTSQGYLLFEFLQGFSEFLTEYGLPTEPIQRTFEKFSPQKDRAHLDLHRLGTVDVVDKRFNPNDPPVGELIEKLRSTFLKEKIEFKLRTELVTSSTSPTLILQDYNAPDFAPAAGKTPAGKYHGRSDPKQEIASNHAYKMIPKQWLDVRPRVTTKAISEGEGDDLEPVEPSGIDQPRNLRVALTQLLLKKIIIESSFPPNAPPTLIASGSKSSAIRQLPFLDTKDSSESLGDYAYICRETITGDSDYTLFYADNDELRFVDLNDDPAAVIKVCDKYDLSWQAIWTNLHSIHFRTNVAGVVTKELPSFDLVLGHSISFQIELVDEIVLFDYKEMERRNKMRIDPHPISEWKRLQNYQTTVPNATLQNQIAEYCSYLDKLAARGRRELSYPELTTGEIGKEVARIFGYSKKERKKQDQDETFNFTNLIRMYQHKSVQMFPSEKNDKLHAHTGIRYDPKLQRYMVGDKGSMNKMGQPKAHRIRQVTPIVGELPQNMALWLHSMSVLFIRYENYTVRPYPFTLIRMYNDIIKSR